ncbi:small RNA 2'-O-methyltransferase-like [Argentina anserina]|uniref:small RNA 2'-O-methyltransferase-like n=1 Tax=Argentina anserina TaxID=57926 RepID=UPI0021763063|nr:small RNA 2'-O-methyltransferase-like [Potentilla anserina]
METEGASSVTVRKNTQTPKAIIHEKFGANACYTLEEVHESAENGCPGLAIVQKGPCLYCCTLKLPEITVVSGKFKKKKDAEQAAAELALEKLRFNPAAKRSSLPETWDGLVSQVKYLFSDEFLSSLHPLGGHLRAALQREGHRAGFVPACALAVFDATLNNLCKSIDPKVELDPFLIISYVIRAAARLSGYIASSEEELWIRRENPYPPEIIELSCIQPIPNKSGCPEILMVEAIIIPCSLEKTVERVILNLTSSGYYLDAIAKQLGLLEASDLMISRPIGKASSETRLHFAAPKQSLLDISSDAHSKEVCSFEGSSNARASYLSGQNIYGDAILATIGYTWRSKDLFYEDVSLKSYYRMLIGKTPSGLYKLSRGKILAAELPLAFTTNAKWKGLLPREILCTFCRQHRLSQPIFSTLSLEESSDSSQSHKKLRVTDLGVKDTEHANGCVVATGANETVKSGGSFSCELKVHSKFQDLILECSPKISFRMQNDSVQNASLKVLLWLDIYFTDPNVSFETLKASADDLDIRFEPNFFVEAFKLCQFFRNVGHSEIEEGKLVNSNSVNVPKSLSGQGLHSLIIEGPDSGVCPSNGSLSCVSYSASLVTEEHMKEQLESSDDFEFEIASGAVNPHLESVLIQMSVGQSACFFMDLPPQDLIFAAADDSARMFSLLSSKTCCLEFTIRLLRVIEPLEDRMEHAFFSPPLSKQRVEYAVQSIRESCSATLVDFGCGSGSLLDSLLNYPTSLEKIAGVDLSQKSLTSAAKILNTKLSSTSDVDISSTPLKSAILYDGSVTDSDSRLCGFDIGTCLEVIEHMEEDQAHLFGNVALSYFCPKILIVSTPNYEYNVILQKSTLSTPEDDPDERSESQPCKFRNHDHKFEWTRAQFNCWATELATRHNYDVEFSGVGGYGDEPGFASQIAVFRQRTIPQEDHPEEIPDSEHPYQVIWEWTSNDRS